VASLFTLLILLWIIVDALLLPIEVLLPIVIIRLISTGHFYYLSRYKVAENNLKRNLLVLGGLLINLPLTFFASADFLTQAINNEMGQLALQMYTILPYVAIGLIGLL
jgi:hypothetical protein